MIHPQELEVWYVIPAVRREIANELVSMGWKQKEAATALGVTEAAISQYANKKRGSGKIILPKEFKDRARIVAGKIASGEITSYSGIQVLLKEFRKSKALCSLHCTIDKAGIPEGCDACL